MRRTAVLKVLGILLLLVCVPHLAAAQCTFQGAVSQMDPQTLYIGLQASIPQTGALVTCSFPFSLPSPGRVIALQGTLYRLAVEVRSV